VLLLVGAFFPGRWLIGLLWSDSTEKVPPRPAAIAVRFLAEDVRIRGCPSQECDERGDRGQPTHTARAWCQLEGNPVDGHGWAWVENLSSGVSGYVNLMNLGTGEGNLLPCVREKEVFARYHVPVRDCPSVDCQVRDQDGRPGDTVLRICWANDRADPDDDHWELVFDEEMGTLGYVSEAHLRGPEPPSPCGI
jgi:hypothetical protein